MSILCLCISPALATDNSTVTCGVILPLSGDLAQSGQELLNGIEIAVDGINNEENTGFLVNLDIRDDMGDPVTARNHFRDMQSAGIPVIIGSYATVLTLPMTEEITKTPQTILISPQANGNALYGISPGFYQIHAPVFYLSRFIAEWISFTAERVSILYVENEYGTSLMEGIIQDLKGGPAQVTSTEPLNTETDIKEAIQRVLDGGPDTVVIGVYDARQREIISELADAGFRGQVILTDVSRMKELEENMSESLQMFSLCILSSTTSLVPGAHTDRFIRSYQEKFKEEPSGTIAGYGYDAMMVIAGAIRQTGETDNISASSIRKGLDAIQYYGVTGPKVFDEKNAVNPAMDRWVYRNGTFELLTTSVI